MNGRKIVLTTRLEDDNLDIRHSKILLRGVIG